MESLGGYYQLYRRLMDHWRQVFPGRIHDVIYENLVADPETGARNLIELCNLPWEEGCLSFHQKKRLVATASAGQVREPVYTRSVDRWQRFADYLDPLREVLGPYVDPAGDGGW